MLPQNRYNEALSFIQGGLNDLSLSRHGLTWGVPVPWDPEQTIYVWIDALLNYYSALRYARPGEDLTERFWPPTVHLIAKDILKFHAVIWPALLMAAELEQPRKLFIHGYLLMDDHKMSKSLGNVLDPFEVMDVYGTDALRYYLLREVGFGQDGSISPEGFETRYVAELANEYGNLASRTLAMIGKYRDGVVPNADPAPEIAMQFDGLADDGPRADRPRRGQRGARGRLGAGPARSTATSPTASRGSSRRTRARRSSSTVVLYTLAEGLRVVSVLLRAVDAGDDRAAADRARAGRRRARQRASSARAPAARRSASSASSSRASSPRPRRRLRRPRA